MPLGNVRFPEAAPRPPLMKPQPAGVTYCASEVGRQRLVAADTGRVHTPTMTLKNAALLALIGTILATVLLVWTFVLTFVNVLRGLTPPALLFPWFVYAFACFSMAVFFYVFQKTQS
jgi:hypothetical protein